MGRDTELFKAAKTGNTAFLERMFASYLKKNTHSHVFGSGLGSIRKSANPNIQDEAGYTLLHHATLNGQREAVSLLLKCGASTMIPDSSGSCPLHLAAWKGNIEIVNILVQQGPSRANVNHQSDSDDTALHLASQYGYSDVVEFLLERHANPLLTNIKGETPLDLAAQYGHVDTVHLVISHCPEILQLTRPEFTPLHLAARNGHSVVALSLINAGISVNTVCERGTALHEAAMCGKTDTVQLLLDKGTNLELKDSQGRTVFDLLDEYPADKAKEICRMIQKHYESCEKSDVPSAPKRIVAVAQTNCSPLMEESSALAFKKGDSIEIQKRTTRDVFVGSLNGKTGSFFAKDVTFYMEDENNLVPTDISCLPCATPSPDRTPEPERSVKCTVVTKPPYEQLPGFPLRDSVTTETSETSSEASINAHQTAERTDSSASSQTLVPRQSQKRMSNKEKRFQLRKDDGSYSELKPISPHDAQRQFGDSLRLNPVGPAFESQATANDPETVTVHNVVPDTSSESKQGFKGSYYVLEVGNFNSEQLKEVHVSPPAVPGEDGYFMLDPQQFGQESLTQGGAGRVSSAANGQEQNRSSSSLQKYENVECLGIKQSSEGLYDTPRNVRYLRAAATQNHTSLTSSSSSTSPPLTYENVQPERTAQDVRGQLSDSSNRMSCANSTASSYENIELSSTQQNQSNGAGRHLQAGTPEGSVAQQNGGSSQVTTSCDRVHTSENGDTAHSQDNLSGETQTDFDITSSQAPNKSCEDALTNGEKKRRTRREEIYEPIRLGAKDRGQEVNPLQHKEPPQDTQGLKMNGFHGKEEEAVGCKGLNLTVPESGLDVNSQAAQKEHRLSTGSTKIVENSEDPFAGLVISASRQLEEGEGAFDQSEPGARGRAETIWDDDRVQLEWSQIDTLLEDMSGSLLTSPPMSPVAKETSFPSNQSGKLFRWLLGLGLGGYASALESNGFDNLTFLGGDILAMDDLSDIGITDQEDQYNIMAAVNLLPPPPRVREVSTVEEWLGVLQLDHLAAVFSGYSLQKLSNLWDVELATVLSIELLGQRKRLQYGIAELRRAHPEWQGQRLPGSSPSKSNPQSQENAISLYKDYRNIKSTASPRTSRVEIEMTQNGSCSAIAVPDSEVVVRPPKVAQGNVAGIIDRHCSLPSDMWQHSTAALLKEAVTYKAKYLGSVIVKRVHGTQSTEEACLRLRTSTENMGKLPEIILLISWKGVKFVDAHSKMIVSTHVIRDISYCSQDIEDKRVFAYITKDKSGMNYCHVFMAASEEIAGEVLMTIAQAFEITYQKVMMARVGRKGRQEEEDKRQS